MNIDDISKKLVKKNIKQYHILLFCLTVSVSLVTSLTLIIFSPSIQNNITKGGGVYDQAMSALILLIICSLVFVLYANLLFIKYKSKEIGIFISLGLDRKSIKKILLKELSLVLPIGVVVGLAISVPITYVFWKLVVSNFDVGLDFKFNLLGFIVGLIIGMFIIGVQRFVVSRYIRKTEIMKLLQTNSVPEYKFKSNCFSAIIFLSLSIISVYGWYNSSVAIWFYNQSYMSIVFAVFSLLLLYLATRNIYTLGNLIKRYIPNTYYKNMVFFSFLKIKSQQYANIFFAVIVLIGITVYMSISSFIPILASDEMIDVSYPYDFSIRKTYDQNTSIEKSDIDKIAKQYKGEIYDYDEIEVLVLAREEIDNYIWTMAVIDEKEYNRVYHDNLNVEKNKFVMVTPNKIDANRAFYNNIKAIIIDSNLNRDLKVSVKQSPH